MQIILSPLRELAGFDQLKDALKRDEAICSVSGLADSQKLHMIYGLGEGFRTKVIVACNALKAKELMEEYRFYDRNVSLYPAKDLIFFQADIHGNQLVRERVRVIRRLMERKPITIVTTYDAMMTPLTLWDPETDCITLEKGGLLQERELSAKLVNFGYEKVYQVESPGQFAVRGGIIDIFDLTEENPYRIELWGDEIDSMRSFDVLSQRSIEQLESLTVYPATEFVMDEERMNRGLQRIEKEAQQRVKKLRDAFETEAAHRLSLQVKELREQLVEFKSKVNLESYIRYFYEDTVTLPELLQHLAEENGDRRGPVFFLDEQSRIREAAETVELEFRESMTQRAEKGYILPGQMDLLYSGEQVAAVLSHSKVVLLSVMEGKSGYFKPAVHAEISSRNAAPYNRSFETLVKDLTRYKKQGYRVLLLSGSRTRAKRLAEDLRDNDLTAVYTEDPYREILPGEIVTFYGHVSRGFEYPDIRFIVLTETDIFGAEQKKKKRRKTGGSGHGIKDYNDLTIGDYVVHEHYGVGIYRGIEKIEHEGVEKDYVRIEYAEGGTLFVLATALDMLQKYASSDAAKPKINRIGSKEWEKTKTKVKAAVEEVANELVELYAARQVAEGYQYGPDTVWQKEFEEMFPFEETEDQLDAIAATKADMQSRKVMDRLICGDVGYGKTEIAIRAAFKAVQEGKQVVYLVPTTILAQQHYATFVQRMKDFPVTVELMSRFRTGAEIRKTITGLKKGTVDIVIGTHRVLSGDVSFKDLGLLIIDEEQRFGVAHKEKIKKLKENVDVLTLTATPIPRTLHMSLIGIRDMSVLEEAPEDRLPIQTFVCEYNEEMVREAICRELARGGQVYYVYNRVHNIADVTARLEQLVPEATFAYAHGQMNERELERIMYEFVNGEIDVLVSTTIIETGLDISNANTLIISEPENMGLSQLYQLRGRVGRSNRTAYAFLLYQRDKMLKEVAEKRLAAIREFTDLGSGFKIAMRDLEIRGAGNLLGMRQHGHMEAVGYELYCKMLNEAVQNRKGIKTIGDFSTCVELDADAYIPASYIVNENQKFDIYKKIANIESEKERDDMRDELLDRFGKIPLPVENLLRIALIRVAAHRLYVTEIGGRFGHIVIKLRPDANLDGARIPALLQEFGSELAFSLQGIPSFTCKYKKTGIVETNAQLLLDKTEQILQKMEMLRLKDETV